MAGPPPPRTPFGSQIGFVEVLKKSREGKQLLSGISQRPGPPPGPIEFEKDFAKKDRPPVMQLNSITLSSKRAKPTKTQLEKQEKQEIEFRRVASSHAPLIEPQVPSAAAKQSEESVIIGFQPSSKVVLRSDIRLEADTLTTAHLFES